MIKANQSMQGTTADIEQAIQYVLDKKAEKRNCLRETCQTKIDSKRMIEEELRLTKA
jgi:hypothetical protein